MLFYFTFSATFGRLCREKRMFTGDFPQIYLSLPRRRARFAAPERGDALRAQVKEIVKNPTGQVAACGLPVPPHAPSAMNYAIILAGGTGSRMGAAVPKQMLALRGRTVLEHSVEAFAAHPLIHRAVIVAHPTLRPEVEGIVARRQAAGCWAKVCATVDGGGSRALSSLAGLRAVERLAVGDAGACVLLHDAARPLVSAALIARVCRALEAHRAVNVGIPVVDTIAEHDGHRQVRTLDRSRLLRIQTPQGFRLATVAEAYRRAMADPAFTATDDCGVVMRYCPQVGVHLVEGEECNAKLTYASDLPLFEHWMAQAAQGGE